MTGFPHGFYPNGFGYFVDTNGNLVFYHDPTQTQGSSGSNTTSNSYNQASVDVGGCKPPGQYSQGIENTPSPEGSMVQQGVLDFPQTLFLLPPRGDLVPQMRYGMRTNKKGGFCPAPPITFAVGNQSGILLQDAIDERFEGLLARDDGMFVGCRSTAISFRIQLPSQWPGLQPWTCHINTLDWKKSRGAITRSKLTYKIAKAVNSFIEVNQGMDTAEEDWRVGVGHIELKDLILDRIDQVSKGSWQPQIYVMRP
ncbi:hypothetical protein BJ322DRAFT_822813 [Thelephora terrestris]|uniref:Uncharacterized protein n=1 Tax=Thelephora terrestris TaxID=56493 RepID=A0A9P6HGA3_9AGAM|nr:hypothetical protein BJ322DRAFT_822813 [Thelephora terrestris]